MTFIKADVTSEIITPQQAQVILDGRFECQRKMRESHVNRLANEIINGRFILGPDCLVLIKGQLANGQHRLSAVIKANRPCPFLVLRSNDKKLFDIIDRNKVRTIGDLLGQDGFSYTNHIAGVVKQVLSYQKGFLSQRGGSTGMIFDSESLDYARENYSYLLEESEFTYAVAGNRLFFSRNAATFLLEISRIAGHLSKAKEFIEGVYSGNVPRNSVPWQFRERLINNISSKARLPRPYILALAIKALRAYISGKQITILKMVDGEEFPKL